VYRFQGMENVLQDIRYALRTLRKSPGFTGVAVAMLALGIGINAAVFTVINAALFDGYPLVHRNDRIVQITANKGAIYYPDFADWRARAKSFEAVVLVRAVFHTFSDASGAPETYLTTEVSANLFSMLGVQPILGRDFLPSDEVPGAEPVVMLRYEVWMNRFGANPAIVGQTVRVDGQPARVIGVMPHGFAFPWTQDLWMPLIPNPPALRRETYYATYAYARLADGVTITSARAEMETIGRQLASAYPKTNGGVAPVLKGFDQWFISANERTVYKSMWGAVLFVLLIVCANVANLLVGRAMGRSHEISIRLALGAGSWRIVRQFLVESLTMSILGGLGGWWIAKAGVHAYALAQARNSVIYGFTMDHLTMDHRVLAYLIAISIGAGLLVGLATAIYLTKLNINTSSKGGKHGERLSDLFVSVEMVLAIAIGAESRNILVLVFHQGIIPVGLSLIIGLAGAVALNRVLKSQLVGVSPADPVALLAASAVLVLSAALGCWIPARRAARVDPVVALRHE
jgi:putative ABC transport system permease protein